MTVEKHQNTDATDNCPHTDESCKILGLSSNVTSTCSAELTKGLVKCELRERDGVKRTGGK